jgi:hypothetical protein
MHYHPHLENLRQAGFGEIAEAVETSGSSAETLAMPPTWVEAQKLKYRIDDAKKLLAELPGGSTLIATLDRMARRFSSRIDETDFR